MSKRKNTRPAPSPQPLPRYEWPTPGADLPRLSWSDWLRLYALDVARSIPGAPGAFLAQYIGGLAEQALVLGAVDPDSHLALAQAEQERESAWIQALEAEAADAMCDLGYAPHQRDKLLGWPSWPQYVDYPSCRACGRELWLVFQLESDQNLWYMFGDEGCGHITCCPDHPEELAFLRSSY